MKRFLALGLLLASLQAWSLELEYLNQVILPHQMKFKKTRIGGLSGLTYDPQTKLLTAVSDDRGHVNEPRLYQFQVTLGASEFKVEPIQVITLTTNQGPLSHKSTRSKAKLFSKVLDLEGIAPLPWGDFLVSNEGDNNKKPRVSPQILDLKPDGTIFREFEVPEAFLPEAVGEQKKGVKNNLAFESLAANPNGKEWITGTESSLVQDSGGFIRLLTYHMAEAWVLKPQKEFQYPLESSGGGAPGSIQLQKGVSEVHFLDESRLFVLERSLRLGKGGTSFSVQIYLTDLKQADKNQVLPRTLVLDVDTLSDRIGRIENFEGMTLGPRLSDGRRTLLLASDDNFMRDQRTQFLIFAIKESSHGTTDSLETSSGR